MNKTTTATLTEFLLARIAEDVAAADSEARSGHLASCVFVLDDTRCDCDHPARVLSECEAKRRIVECLQLAADRSDAVDTIEIDYCLHREVLGLMALPFADHPDYDPEWAL